MTRIIKKKRSCGTCSACCRWPSVSEIEKPARTPCQYLGKKGYRCTIYEDRPSTCSKYQCSWIRGIGKKADQPDKCHVLIDRRNNRFGYVLVAKPLRFSTATSRRGQGVISCAAAQDGMLCLIMDYHDPDKVVGVAGPKAVTTAFEQATAGRPVWLAM